MKLLFCKECNSIFNLTIAEKTCECGKTKGKYVDNLNAEYSGPGIPLGFSNNSLIRAIKIQEMLNELEKDNPKVCCKGEEFTAFTIPQWADSIKNQNKDK